MAERKSGGAGAGACSSAWARLVPLKSAGEDIGDIVYISSDKFHIGRSPDNDLSLTTKMNVSTKHGFICKEGNSKAVYSDLSSNGTLVDGKKLVKGMTAELKSGDEIHFVFRKNSGENVAYTFEILPISSDVGASTLGYDTDCEVVPTDRGAGDGEALGTEAKRPRLADKDDLEETMRCPICQEILHGCVSLQPCLHTFCGGCYAEWKPVSSQCPTCRAKVKCFAKNHMIQNLVDAFLKKYPEKMRPKEALDELDEKFKAIAPTLGKRNRARAGDDDGSEDTDEDDESDDDIDSTTPIRHITGHMLMSGLPRAFSFPVCRECPGFVPVGTPMPRSDGSLPMDGGAAPSSSSADASAAATSAGRPSFSCPPGQRHIVCWCCLQMMPDRTGDLPSQPSLPGQHCALCQQPFCGAYWRCGQPGCTGCLFQLKDFSANDSCLSDIVMKNAYESGILKDYLSRNGKTVRDLVIESCIKLDAGQYTLSNDYVGPLFGHGVRSTSYVCRRCAMLALRELAYQFRRDIPDLPDCVTRRPNCHWGRNCRTQTNKPEHAVRFNHLCAQTRWT